MTEVQRQDATTIQHQPWVGDLFGKHDGPHLMVLGESHHGDNREAANMTCDVVEDWLSGASNRAYRFFTHLAIAISGQEPSTLNRRDVFRPIMFYNYVRLVMHGSRVAPTTEDFADSEPAFREIIEQYHPTHIIVCGRRLWENLPSFDPPDKEGQYVRLADMDFHVGRYRTANSTPLAMCIKHPQSGFNGRIWHPRLKAFVSLR